MADDSQYMKRALTIARRGRTSPNPMVGAVVVRDGRIVGEGYHPRAGEPHAEVFALQSAGDVAKGAELYVTLEPCCHHGKTGPCTEAIIAAGITKVYAAMVDPFPEVAGKGIETLRSAGIEVEVGLLEAEARELNRGFIKWVTCGRPFVLWKAAMTLDGKIATRTGDSRWVTGEKSRAHVHRLRSQSDAIMVGIGTVLMDDPALTNRQDAKTAKDQPIRIVVDSEGRIPLSARVLSDEAPTLVVTTKGAPDENVDRLRGAGIRVLQVNDNGSLIDPGCLLRKLGNMGIHSVLLEGGGELAASMIAAGVVDRGLIFISPKIVGGRDAKSPVEGEGIESMADALTTSKPLIRRFGDDVALEFEFGPQRSL